LTLFVDTTVWSLYFRRDVTPRSPEIVALRQTLFQGEAVATGLVLQELLQGILGPRARTTILEHFTSIHMIVPSRDDHVEAAELRNHCRRAGVQVGTVDALIAQLCMVKDLELLTIDKDFTHVSRNSRLRVWQP
jgi:predicted nucleic acid-binding protein